MINLFQFTISFSNTQACFLVHWYVFHCTNIFPVHKCIFQCTNTFVHWKYICALKNIFVVHWKTYQCTKRHALVLENEIVNWNRLINVLTSIFMHWNCYLCIAYMGHRIIFPYQCIIKIVVITVQQVKYFTCNFVHVLITL